MILVFIDDKEENRRLESFPDDMPFCNLMNLVSLYLEQDDIDKVFVRYDNAKIRFHLSRADNVIGEGIVNQ